MATPDRHAALDAGLQTDLRRRVRRDHAQQLVQRAAVLPARDRALVEAVYRDGRPVTEIASLTGENPRTLRRRVRILTRRLASSRFLFVLHHRELWPPTRHRVADACVIEGKSLREAAEALSLTLHNVRRHREAIEAAYETLIAAARRPAQPTSAAGQPTLARSAATSNPPATTAPTITARAQALRPRGARP